MTFSKIVFVAALIGAFSVTAVEVSAKTSKAKGTNVTVSAGGGYAGHHQPTVAGGAGLSASQSEAETDCKCGSAGATAGGGYLAGGLAGSSRGGSFAGGFAGGVSVTSANAN